MEACPRQNVDKQLGLPLDHILRRSSRSWTEDLQQEENKTGYKSSITSIQNTHFCTVKNTIGKKMAKKVNALRHNEVS